jgi:histidinol-phosphatase
MSRTSDLSGRLESAIELAREAGELTLRYFRTDLAVELKHDETPVTQADRGAEALIREGIGKRFPEDSILGEEHGFHGGSGATWVIDPIDGTRSFIAGVPLYAVLIACVDGRYDGSEEIPTDRVLLGVIHVPPAQETLWASRDAGAFLNGMRCNVSSHRSVSGCRFATSDFADLARREPALFASVADGAAVSRTWGDAYGYMLVATGRIDAMIDPIVSPWDIAPLPVILEEAGGACTDLDGRRVLGRSVVASNGLLQEELLSLREPN